MYELFLVTEKQKYTCLICPCKIQSTYNHVHAKYQHVIFPDHQKKKKDEKK